MFLFYQYFYHSIPLLPLSIKINKNILKNNKVNFKIHAFGKLTLSKFSEGFEIVKIKLLWKIIFCNITDFTFLFTPPYILYLCPPFRNWNFFPISKVFFFTFRPWRLIFYQRGLANNYLTQLSYPIICKRIILDRFAPVL